MGEAFACDLGGARRDEPGAGVPASGGYAGDGLLTLEGFDEEAEEIGLGDDADEPAIVDDR